MKDLSFVQDRGNAFGGQVAKRFDDRSKTVSALNRRSLAKLADAGYEAHAERQRQRRVMAGAAINHTIEGRRSRTSAPRTFRTGSHTSVMTGEGSRGPARAADRRSASTIHAELKLRGFKLVQIVPATVAKTEMDVVKN